LTLRFMEGNSSRMKKTFLLGVALSLSMGSCAILRAGDTVTAAFMSESDPELAGDAFPTMIKAAEALSMADPRDAGKATLTASLYVMYASAFLEGNAFLLPDDDYDAKRALTARANALYLRAAGLLRPFVSAMAPGVFRLEDPRGDPAVAELARFSRKDVPLLYWTAASIFAGFSSDPMDFDNAALVGAALALFERALELDPDWNGGALHELAITVYGSLPADLGGDQGKALSAFEAAKAATGSVARGPYLAYALAVCVARGDEAGFRAALEAASSLADRPGSALMDSLARRKASRLLNDIRLYF